MCFGSRFETSSCIQTRSLQLMIHQLAKTSKRCHQFLRPSYQNTTCTRFLSCVGSVGCLQQLLGGCLVCSPRPFADKQGFEGRYPLSHAGSWKTWGQGVHCFDVTLEEEVRDLDSLVRLAVSKTHFQHSPPNWSRRCPETPKYLHRLWLGGVDHRIMFIFNQAVLESVLMSGATAWFGNVPVFHLL